MTFFHFKGFRDVVKGSNVPKLPSNSNTPHFVLQFSFIFYQNPSSSSILTSLSHNKSQKAFIQTDWECKSSI